MTRLLVLLAFFASATALADTTPVTTDPDAVANPEDRSKLASEADIWDPNCPGMLKSGEDNTSYEGIRKNAEDRRNSRGSEGQR